MTSLPIGALFGALLGGTLAHQFGRKRILSIALLTLTVTSLGAALAPNVIILIICRCIMGFAIGMDSPVAFTFIAEISNLKHKGRNVNYWQVVWYVAIVTSALVVTAFFMLGAGAHLWRYAVGFGALIAFVLYILRIKYLHESPTWVINHYSLEKATEFIRKYYHKDIHLEGTLEDDLNSDVTSPHNSWTDLFKPRYIKELSWRLRFQHYKVCSTMVSVYTYLLLQLILLVRIK